MFARVADLYVVAPGVSVRTAEEESRALTSLSNGLELEWHENVLAFDGAVKMLEAPLTCPRASADASRFLGGLRWVRLHSAASLEPPESAGPARKSHKVEHKYSLCPCFRAPLLLGSYSGSQSCCLTGFCSSRMIYSGHSVTYACARTADATAETKQVKYV